MINFSTNPIELNVSNGQAVTLTHGLGRPVTGWLVIYQSAVVDFIIEDLAADTRNTLVLIPNNDAFVRLVLLS